MRIKTAVSATWHLALASVESCSRACVPLASMYKYKYRLHIDRAAPRHRCSCLDPRFSAGWFNCPWSGKYGVILPCIEFALSSLSMYLGLQNDEII